MEEAVCILARRIAKALTADEREEVLKEESLPAWATKEVLWKTFTNPEEPLVGRPSATHRADPSENADDKPFWLLNRQGFDRWMTAPSTKGAP